MFYWKLSLLILLNITSSLFALEISINSAREEHQRYSILHLQDSKNFTCQEIKDDFETVVKIVCAYSKRPVKTIKKLQNDFFKINTIIKKKTFFVIITPFKKMKLEPIVFNLTKDNSVFNADVSISKHWMVIGYKDKLPLIHENRNRGEGINFPYFSKADKYPFVGGLDIKGNPVHIQKVDDVSDYLKIKKYFNEKKYDKILELIDELLVTYPNTLFKAELLYYKIKVYAKLNDNDNVIEISKVYLREYSWDENIPEILSLTARAYSMIGLNSDADYFFDRLFSEHENSIFTKWGYIYKGEMLEASGGKTVAISFYKKALNETKNLEIAETAAYNLAYINIKTSSKKATKFMMKIIKAKPSFLINDLKKSQDMMYTFADREDYITASSMAKALSDTMNKRDDDYENLLKNRAIWLSKTDEKSKAIEAIKKYIKEFPDGDYINEIEIVKDKLFFDSGEKNVTVRLDEYNKLINNYRDDSIGDRAIYEKAKLLLNLKKYQSVLDNKIDILNLDEDKYSDINRIIKDSAIGVMKESLSKKRCHEVLKISNEYNITLSNKWDDGLYDCAMKGGDFLLAKSIANKNFKSKDLDFRKKWLFRYIKVDFQTGNYSDVIDASKDLIALIDGNKNSKYRDVYRYIFDTYQRLEQKNRMITSIVDIEKEFGTSFKDLDRYIAVMMLGDERKDDNIVIKYGTKAMNIQMKSEAYPQSPLLEFTLYQAYMNEEEYIKALEIIKFLNNIKISKMQRARQKYLLGTVYSKLWRDKDAKNAYQKAIDVNPSSPWAKLAKSAMSL